MSVRVRCRVVFVVCGVSVCGLCGVYMCGVRGVSVGGACVGGVFLCGVWRVRWRFVWCTCLCLSGA